MTRDVTAAILAGGRARRLDNLDKCSLVVGGERLIDRQLAQLSRVADHVLVISGQARPELGVNVRVVTDVVPDAGPLGGIHAALTAAPTSQVLIVACDLPFLTEPFLRLLLAAGRDVDVAMPRTADGLHPLCASYDRTALPAIEEHLRRGSRRVTEALAGLRVREIGLDALAPLDPDGVLLLNVNTPQDLARAEAFAAVRR